MNNRTVGLLNICALAVLSSLFVTAAVAQSGSSELVDETLDLAEELDDATTDRTGSLVAVPIGAGGFYSDSESWGFGLAQRFYLKEDRMRLLFGALTTEINYDFFGIGNEAGESGDSIPLTQEADAVSATFEYRVAGDLFVGLRLSVADIVSSVNLSIPAIPRPFLDFDLAATTQLEEVGFIVRLDHRDHVYAPSDGSLTNLTLSSRKVTGLLKPRRYEKYKFDYNRYRPLENAVLAYRVSACYVGKESPFYDVCSFGANSDLRGYTTGRYRDRSQVTVQAEYRRPIAGRWAWAAFAGVGAIAPTFSDLSSDELLPAVGAGLRFTVSEQQRISLRVDFARGADESTLHISVGEAF